MGKGWLVLFFVVLSVEAVAAALFVPCEEDVACTFLLGEERMSCQNGYCTESDLKRSFSPERELSFFLRFFQFLLYAPEVYVFEDKFL